MKAFRVFDAVSFAMPWLVVKETIYTPEGRNKVHAIKFLQIRGGKDTICAVFFSMSLLI